MITNRFYKCNHYLYCYSGLENKCRSNTIKYSNEKPPDEVEDTSHKAYPSNAVLNGGGMNLHDNLS